MAISKALAASLDRLSDSISKAEEFLVTSVATAPSVSITVWHNEEDHLNVESHLLEFRPNTGFVKVVKKRFSNGLKILAGKEVKTLMELPIEERKTFAKKIPEFIEKALAEMDKFPNEIDETSDAILKSISIAKTKWDGSKAPMSGLLGGALVP